MGIYTLVLKGEVGVPLDHIQEYLSLANLEIKDVKDKVEKVRVRGDTRILRFNPSIEEWKIPKRPWLLFVQ